MPPSLRTCISAFAACAVVASASAGPAIAGAGDSGRGVRGEAAAESASQDVFTKSERAVKAALTAVGVKYRWGGESPATGFDCSGLVRWAYGQVGIDLPHSSYELYERGRRVARASRAPGDILFFEGLGHVGLYLGRGRMVHAPQSGRRVEVVRLGKGGYGSQPIAARRVVQE